MPPEPRGSAVAVREMTSRRIPRNLGVLSRHSRHARNFIAFHEPSVDPVLPLPYPFALQREITAGRDRVAVTGADQCQRLLLRFPFDELISTQCPPQVLRQPRTGANRIHAGFGPRMILDACDIARGEHLRMRDRLKTLVHYP